MRLEPDELRRRLDAIDDDTREVLTAAGWQRLDQGRERWIDPNTTFRWSLSSALALLRKDLTLLRKDLPR